MPSAPRFRRLELWTNAQCAGGTVVGAIANILQLETEVTVSGDDRLSCAIAMLDSMAGYLIPRYVLRLILTDGSFTEWRIVETQTVTGRIGSAVAVSAQSLLYDMADMALTRTVSSSAGTTLDGGSHSNGTLDTLMTNAVIPYCAESLPWIAKGTIEPTMLFSLEWQLTTPLDLVQQGTAATGGEIEWARNGISGYYLHVRTERNGTADPLIVRVARNLHQLRRKLSAREQANTIDVRASYGTFGLEHQRWKVQSNNTGTNRLTMVGRDDGSGPILEDGQFVGWSLWRARNPKPYTIQNSYAATQEFALTDSSLWVAGDEAELRVNATDGLVTLPWTLHGVNNRNVLRVSSIASNTLTVQEPSSNGDPITVDDEYNDINLVVSQEIATAVQITAVMSGAFTDALVLRMSSVASLQVGDWGFAYTNAAVPWGTSGTPGCIFEITNIDTVNKDLTLKRRHPYTAALTDMTASALANTRWYRPRGLTVTVTDSVAATNALVVNSATGIAATDLVEPYVSVGGRLPTYLDRPTSVASVGVRRGTFSPENQTGLVILNNNPTFSTWTVPASPPDGYTKHASATLTRVTTPLRYGTYGAQLSGITAGVYLETPVCYPSGGIGGSAPLTVTVFFYASANWDVDAQARVTITLLTGNGTTLASTSVAGAGTTAYPNDPKVASQTWITVTLTLADYITPAGLMGNGVKVRLGFNGYSTSAYTVTYDAVLVATGAQVYPEPVTSDFGDGLNLWRRTNIKLAESGDAIATYEVGFSDISRIEDGVEPLAGMPVTLIDPMSATNTNSERLVSYKKNWLAATDAVLTIARRERKLSMMLGGAVANGAPIGYGGTT